MRNLYRFLAVCLLLPIGVVAQKKSAKTEQDYYEIKTLPIPKDIYLEIGGIATMPDGRLAVSTRRGEIWIIENPYQKDSHQTNFKRFAASKPSLPVYFSNKAMCSYLNIIKERSILLDILEY